VEIQMLMEVLLAAVVVHPLLEPIHLQILLVLQVVLEHQITLMVQR
jgi:hypothetical protein